MTTKTDIYNNINNEVKALDQKVNHVKMYNCKVFLKRTGIKAISIVHHVTPFVMASLLISTLNITGRKPFERKTVEEHAIVSTIDTSSGYHHESSTFDYDYDYRSLEYTTGWEEKDGYYNRTIYEYEISNKIDLNDIDSILAMSQEDLKNSLVLINVKTITKPNLSEEDELFYEPAVVVNSFHESEDRTYTRDETDWEVIKYSILYILLISAVGSGLVGLEHLFTKKKIEQKLGELKVRYKRISSSELEDLRKLLEVKKANLDLLNEQQDDSLEMPISPRKVRV